VRGDVLSGFEVPPDIGIGDIARGQGEETEKQDCKKGTIFAE
jgi:hypothetical protein